jgi:lipopolysaccharide transport system permease protein
MSRWTDPQMPETAERPRPTDATASASVARVAEPVSAPVAERPVTVMGPPSFSPTSLVRGVGRLAQYSDLLYTLSLHRLHVRYKQSLLGPLWAVLQPLLLMLIYTVIFTRVATMPSEGVPYPLFAFSALLPWTSFSNAVSTATNSLVGHFNLVTKVYFPREILPLTYVIAAVVDLLAGAVVLAALMLFYGVTPTAYAVLAIPIVIVLASFAVAVALVLSAIQVRYRDIGIAMPLVLQLWLFATPIVYPLGVVPEAWRPFYLLNPMAGVIDGFRRVVVLGTAPDYTALAVSAGVTLVLLPLAYAYFKHVESTVADVL